MVCLHQIEGNVAAELGAPGRADAVSFWWLGQAGFAFRHAHLRFLVDPYLSDSLAEKYRGKELPHIRLTPPPLRIEEIAALDFVLCTHAHSDHLDPGTLPGLAARLPDCRFVIPRAHRGRARQMGLPDSRLLLLDAGERLTLAPGFSATAIPAAHETLQTNPAGEHLFLGYVLALGGLTLYHSGDCVPYDGLLENLQPLGRIDAAFLPVNGRNEWRRSRGVPGNFTFAEAADLCRRLDIRLFIPHHFGMFAFNTVEPQTLREQQRALSPGLDCIVPELNRHYTLTINPPS